MADDAPVDKVPCPTGSTQFQSAHVVGRQHWAHMCTACTPNRQPALANLLMSKALTGSPHKHGCMRSMLTCRWCDVFDLITQALQAPSLCCAVDGGNNCQVEGLTLLKRLVQRDLTQLTAGKAYASVVEEENNAG